MCFRAFLLVVRVERFEGVFTRVSVVCEHFDLFALPPAQEGLDGVLGDLGDRDRKS